MTEEQWRRGIDAQIAYHRSRIERETAKWKPPPFPVAVKVARESKAYGWSSVVESVCSLYKIPPGKLAARRRRTDIECRCAIVVGLREMKYSYPTIARMMGWPSHSSVISAWRRARKTLNERQAGT